MKQATIQKAQNHQVRPMRYDAPNTSHPLIDGGAREQQRIADVGAVVSILARRFAGEVESEEVDDGEVE